MCFFFFKIFKKFKMGVKNDRKTIFGKSSHKTAEIQVGRQNWREKDFWKKSQVDSAYTLWIKNFVEIALARSISEINVWLRFTILGKSHSRLCIYPVLCKNSIWPPKVMGKGFWRNTASTLCIHPVGQKVCWNHSSSHRFRDKCISVVSALRKIVLFS